MVELSQPLAIHEYTRCQNEKASTKFYVRYLEKEIFKNHRLICLIYLLLLYITVQNDNFLKKGKIYPYILFSKYPMRISINSSKTLSPLRVLYGFPQI